MRIRPSLVKTALNIIRIQKVDFKLRIFDEMFRDADIDHVKFANMIGRIPTPSGCLTWR